MMAVLECRLRVCVMIGSRMPLGTVFMICDDYRQAKRTGVGYKHVCWAVLYR